MLKNPSGITVNGQSLESYLSDEAGLEIVSVSIDVVTRLRKDIRANLSGKTRGNGRGAGNPGVRKPKKWTQKEIEAEEIRQGLR
jgi:hypothetical protein